LDIVSYILKSDCTGKYVQVLHEQDISSLRQLFSPWKNACGPKFASCDVLYRLSVWDVLGYALRGSKSALEAPSIAPMHMHQMVGPQFESCVEFYDNLCSLSSDTVSEQSSLADDSSFNSQTNPRFVSEPLLASHRRMEAGAGAKRCSEAVVSRDSAVFALMEEACRIVYAYHPLTLTAFGGYGASSMSIFNRALRLLSAFAAVDALCVRKAMQVMCNKCDAAGLWVQHEPDVAFMYPFVLILQVYLLSVHGSTLCTHINLTYSFSFQRAAL
jgi:hypothetical protein